MPSTISDDDGDRGAGRTTAQIKRAPHRALFIVPNGACVSYTERLAFDAGRADISFVGLDAAKSNGWSMTRGIRGRDAVMIDHACWHFMSESEREDFSELQHAYEW